MNRKPEIRIIAAVGSNGVIGRGNDMPWWVPEEYQHFLNLITNQTVILGRVTYERFKDLPGKRNLVVSHSKNIKGVQVFPSVELALSSAMTFPETIYIAGGETIYQQTLHLSDALYLSFIKGHFTGDHYFPSFSETEWRLESREQHTEFEFRIYQRHVSAPE